MTWHQNNAAVKSTLMVQNATTGDTEFYVAPAGTADAIFATFWGTAKHTIDTSGYIKVAGTYVIKSQGAAVADVASANATDLASAITLVNEQKTQINALLARLRAATGHGIIA
jgi:hypothetical protein